MIDTRDSVDAFDTPLGWMAIVGRREVLKMVTFGYASEHEALRGVERRWSGQIRLDCWNESLALRLRAFADGSVDDFRDVRLDLDHLTAFGRRVVRECRRTGWGQTTTYGELAERAGSPRAARAVGNVMRTNRFALIVPCHRVLAAGGGLGGYSSVDGVGMKQRLLKLEQNGVLASASA